jgi:hypothetical protein
MCGMALDDVRPLTSGTTEPKVKEKTIDYEIDSKMEIVMHF